MSQVILLPNRCPEILRVPLQFDNTDCDFGVPYDLQMLNRSQFRKGPFPNTYNAIATGIANVFTSCDGIHPCYGPAIVQRQDGKHMTQKDMDKIAALSILQSTAWASRHMLFCAFVMSFIILFTFFLVVVFGGIYTYHWVLD